MRKGKTEKEPIEEMLPEYDFSGKKGVRGKYYRAYRQGHSVRIHRANGTVSVKFFTLADGAVMSATPNPLTSGQTHNLPYQIGV